MQMVGRQRKDRMVKVSFHPTYDSKFNKNNGNAK